MSLSLENILSKIEERANTTTQKGQYFERLIKFYLENDFNQNQQYDKVWTYKDWAQENPTFSQTDIGIDLVARFADGNGLCAIQTKFYDKNFEIKKSDLDSFVSASASNIFTRRLLYDTSSKDLGRNARSMVRNLGNFDRPLLDGIRNSRIDWEDFLNNGKLIYKSRFPPRDHQNIACKRVKNHFKNQNRCHIVMACGTGKTYTSLLIAERLFPGKRILFLVPSLSLLSQTLYSWRNNSEKDFYAFSVCSDRSINNSNKSDESMISSADIDYSSTTNPEKLARNLDHINEDDKMIVVFATYHSIDVIKEAQDNFGCPNFDLIICDEAHRTTGVTLSDQDESHFVKVHDNNNVKGDYRLYMTATPKIYGEKSKEQAEGDDAIIASMDDVSKFGKLVYAYGFSKAVEEKLLCDYKVVILALEEKLIKKIPGNSLDPGGELNVEDATKIIGCYKALLKEGLLPEDSPLSRAQASRALGFCQNIKVSKLISSNFQSVVHEYLKNEPKDTKKVKVFSKHIDGTFNSKKRDELLSWLKEDTIHESCKILTNARCLSEGIDVPSLDAILFFHPRNSPIDVVQSVGRVMRTSVDTGKDMGYVILPVAIPDIIRPEDSLSANKRYKVIWQVLNALRTHDENLDKNINQLAIGEDVSDKIEIISIRDQSEVDNVTHVVEKYKKPKKKDNTSISENTNNFDDQQENEHQTQAELFLDDFTNAIRAKIVEKCGTREYWDIWVSDIAKYAKKVSRIINEKVSKKDTNEYKLFQEFLHEIRDDINPSVTKSDAIEMLSQHIITKPVFDALFKEFAFSQKNPVSIALNNIVQSIGLKNFESESDSLGNFYKNIKRKADGIKTLHVRQATILDLYERFFKKAFPDLSEKLGIVYTPVELVDFAIHSTEFLYKINYNKSLGDKGVRIIDPFAGTGTFISQLLQSKIISDENLKHKFNNDIQCNEIILLAFYICSVNIESVFYDRKPRSGYSPFQGVLLTDTLNLFEQEKDEVSKYLKGNSQRRTKQKSWEPNVILANPPYYSKNNNKYNKILDIIRREIKPDRDDATYINALFDPYVYSIIWSLNNISKSNGITCLITPNSWLHKNTFSGLRKYLYDNLKEIIIFDLKGDIRKRRFNSNDKTEGGNIFGNKNQQGICLSFFIKSKNKNNRSASIKYYSIPDGLTTSDKKTYLSKKVSIKEFIKNKSYKIIKPNSYNDWLNKRIAISEDVYRVSNKKGSKNFIFLESTSGVKTNRDAFCVNFSPSELAMNMERSIKRYSNLLSKGNKSIPQKDKNIKRDGTLDKLYERKERIVYSEEKIFPMSYRPFTQKYLYFCSDMNNSVYKNHKFFPNKAIENYSILIPNPGSRNEFSCFGSKNIVNYDYYDKTECLYLYFYSENKISNDSKKVKCGDKIYWKNLNFSHEFYDLICKCLGYKCDYESLIHYIYGMFWSEKYRTVFAKNLKKEIPPVPLLKGNSDYKKLIEYGKNLFDIHVNYLDIEEYNDCLIDDYSFLEKKDINFYKKAKIVSKNETYSLKYDNYVVIKDIPSEAFEVKINGKSFLDNYLSKHKPKNWKDFGITDSKENYLNDISDLPVKNIISEIRKIINLSIKSKNIISKINNLKIDFKGYET